MNQPSILENHHITTTSCGFLLSESVSINSDADNNNDAHNTDKGAQYHVTLIKAGLSINTVYYSKALLANAAHKFNNARVFVAADAVHGKGNSAHILNLVGRITDVVFKDNALQAILQIIAPTHPAITHIQDLIQHGAQDLFGLSIVALGRVKMHQHYKEALSIEQVKSVDLIAIPAAGGSLHTIAEATTNYIFPSISTKGVTMLDMHNLKNDILATQLMSEAEIDNISDVNALQELFQKRLIAMKTYQESRQTAMQYDAAYIESLHKKITLLYAKDKLTEAALPQEASAALWHKFEQATSLTEASINEDIKASLAIAKAIKPSITGHTFSAGETRGDKTMQLFEAVLNGEYSLKDAYRQVTGDNNLTGQVKHCDTSLMSEALSVGDGSFSGALGEAIHKKLLHHYDMIAQFDSWKNFTNETRTSDFREMKVLSIGGYGTLPKVAEQANYSALSSPSEQEATYNIAKYGGTENITMEMIANDDVRAIAQIPFKLASAAKRTLAKTIFDIVENNPAIFDNKNLYHAEHHNIGNYALNDDGLYHMRQLLMRQTTINGADAQYMPPKTLVVPLELERTAYDLFRRSNNNDSNFINNMALDIVVNPFANDPNDWVLFADKMMVPTLEVAYYQGHNNPELFVQDSPQVGSLFNNDTLTYKIRHIWGVGIVDYRGTVKSVISA